MELLNKVINLISNLSSNSTIGNILIIIIVFLGIGVFSFYSWKLSRYKKAKAKKETQQQRQEDQTNVDQEANDLSDDAKQSEGDIDNILKE